jgi:hypothetical protein
MSRPNLQPLYVGITCVYIGLVFTLLSVIGIFLLPRFADRLGLQFIVRMMEILTYVVVGAVLLSVLGKLVCLGAPRDMRGKWAIFAALPCVLLTGIVYAALAFQIQFLFKLIEHAPLLVQRGLFPSILGFALFLIFLRSVATYLNSAEDTRVAIQAIVLGAALLVVNFFGETILVLLKPGLGAIDVYLVVYVALFALFLMRYGRLLTYLRRDIKFAMQSSPAEED